jgi:ribokinase
LVIVGSLNMDLVVRVGRLPKPGETIRAEHLEMIPGGKGANQAVAAARLGAEAVMIGRVGDDVFGTQLRGNLESFGVDVKHVRVTRGCPTGVALISVDAAGQNSITIVSGANGKVSSEDLASLAATIGQADALILQLEIPVESVEAAVSLARQHGVPTVLDPAPAPASLPAALYAVEILSPNQTEAELLTGRLVATTAQARDAAMELSQRGARNVVIKMGADGAVALNAARECHAVAAYPVEVLDTTAAGDAFTAALALKHSQGVELVEATRFACAAGALATTKLGAQPSMPTRAEVEALLAHR